MGSLHKELGVLTTLLNLKESEDATERLQAFAKGREPDWQYLGQLAADHDLRPWLYNHYRQMPEGLIPQEVQQAYKELIDGQRFRQLKLLREFFRIQEALGKEQITLIPFKGFRMARTYYGDSALREYSDLDVLISRAFLRTAIKSLERMGYIIEPGYNPRNLPLVKIIKNYPEYNMDLWENGQRISHVELHWQIASPPHNIGCYLEKMKPFITEGELQGKHYACFTPGGDLLMAAFHHGGKEEWARLGHILDIGMILKNFPDADYNAAISWAEKRELSRIVLTGIQLAHQLCRIDIPQSIRAKANAPTIHSLASNRLEKIRHLASGSDRLPFRFSTTLYHLRTRDSIGAQARFALANPKYFFRRTWLKIWR